MARTVLSGRFEVINQDWKKIAFNALVFAGPALLVLISSVTGVLPKEWMLAPVVLYLLNILTDLLRKFLAENTYRVADK